MSSKEISILKLKCIKKRSREALKASNVGAKETATASPPFPTTIMTLEHLKYGYLITANSRWERMSFRFSRRREQEEDEEEGEKNFRRKRNIWKAIGGEEQWRKKLRTAHETKSVFYLPCLLIKGVFAEQKYKTHLLAPLFSACSFRCLRSRCCLIHANESLRRRKRWVERYIYAEVNYLLHWKVAASGKKTSVASSGGRPSGIMNNFNARQIKATLEIIKGEALSLEYRTRVTIQSK